jgi:AraC family L-rhamnose operon transcriptional activator RhaR/AraC family L-rhamnose operon regulatory protein RhaS
MASFYYAKDIFIYPGFPFFVGGARVADSFDIHDHDFAELVVIHKGRGIHSIENQDYPISAGDVYVIKPGIKHGFHGCRNLILSNLSYDPDNFLISSDTLKQIPGFHTLFFLEPLFRKQHRFECRLRLSPATLSEAGLMIDNMYREFNRPSPGHLDLIRAYFTELVVLLSRAYGAMPKGETKMLFGIAGALAWLETHCLSKISLEDLAEKAGMSSRHFLRLFKTDYHMTPTEYIITKRLENAVRLMKVPEKTLTEIAFESGFEDSNYFSRAFRKWKGVTPREYRRQVLAA